MPTPPRHNYTETINGIEFPMVFVDGGIFFMGEDENYPIQVPDFHIGQTPVTQEQWRAVMGGDPARLYFKGNTRPVERVSWDDIVQGTSKTGNIAFLDAFNQKTPVR
jgi:formylglycine-generating enzyme required for sulfatase activity